MNKIFTEKIGLNIFAVAANWFLFSFLVFGRESTTIDVIVVILLFLYTFGYLTTIIYKIINKKPND